MTSYLHNFIRNKIPRTAQPTSRQALLIHFVHWSWQPHAHVHQPQDVGSCLFFSELSISGKVLPFPSVWVY